MTCDYWNDIAERYQRETYISRNDFHYGPMIPGDSQLKLLPENLDSLKCLEIACGGAQNSIFLAKNNAECKAFDASKEQIKQAEIIASESKVKLKLEVRKIEDLADEDDHYDLIHSAYGLNFTSDFPAAIKCCSELLTPSGVLLFSMPHPLFSGELLELDGLTGLFISDYFHIEPEYRYDDDGREIASSNFYTTDYVSKCLAANGFLIERICEPEVCENPPYSSQGWENYREQLSLFPASIIFKAVKVK